MARVQRYQQGQLASSLVGTAGVDTSGSIISSAVARSAAGMADSIGNSEALRQQQLIHQANQNFSGVAQNLREQAYETKLQARHAQTITDHLEAEKQKLFDNTQAAKINTAVTQMHVDRMNSLNSLDTDYNGAIKSTPDAIQGFVDKAVAGKEYPPSVMLQVLSHSQSLNESTIKELGKRQSDSQAGLSKLGVAQTFDDSLNRVKASNGNPTIIKQQLDIMNSLPTATQVATAYGADEAFKKLQEQKKNIVISGFNSGFVAATDKQSVIEKSGGVVLDGIRSQRAQLQRLDTYLNTSEYSKHLLPEDIKTLRGQIATALNAVDADEQEAKVSGNAGAYMSVQKAIAQIHTAELSNDNGTVARVGGMLNGVLNVEMSKPAQDQDMKLIKLLNSTLGTAGSAKKGIDSAATSQALRGLAADNQKVAEERQKFSDNLEENNRLKAAYAERNKTIYESRQALDARNLFSKKLSSLAEKINAVKDLPENATTGVYGKNGVVGKTGITAKEIHDAAIELEDLFAHKYVKPGDNPKDYNGMRSFLDGIRKKVTPVDLQEGHTVDPGLLDVFVKKQEGITPNLTGFLGLDAHGKEAMDAKFSSMYDTELKNYMAANAGKVDKLGVTGGKARAIAAQITEQKILNEFMKAPPSSFVYPAIVLPKKPSKESMAGSLGNVPLPPPGGAFLLPTDPGSLEGFSQPTHSGKSNKLQVPPPAVPVKGGVPDPPNIGKYGGYTPAQLRALADKIESEQ